MTHVKETKEAEEVQEAEQEEAKEEAEEARGAEIDVALIDAEIARGQYIVVDAAIRVTADGSRTFSLEALEREVTALGKESAYALSRTFNGTPFRAHVVVPKKKVLLIFSPVGPVQQEFWDRAKDKPVTTLLEGWAVAAKAIEDEREAVKNKKKFKRNKKTAVIEDTFLPSLKRLAHLKADCEIRLADGSLLTDALGGLCKDDFKPLVLPVEKDVPLVCILRSHDSLKRVAYVEVTDGLHEKEVLRIDWEEDVAFTAALKRCYCTGKTITLYVERRENVLWQGGHQGFRATRFETADEQIVCAEPVPDLATQAEVAAKQAA